MEGETPNNSLGGVFALNINDDVEEEEKERDEEFKRGHTDRIPLLMGHTLKGSLAGARERSILGQSLPGTY